jgi:energy-coupling factor transporter ATP-binding protein EcfA2
MKSENPEIDKFHTLYEQGHSIFLTGKAGTGKSTLIKSLLDLEKNLLYLAPTGIAAINIGGETIHSFFKLPFRPLLPNDEEIKSLSGRRLSVTDLCDTIIIDEISMVRADILDAIDTSLRKSLNMPDKLFGGKQMIFVGDPYQLEPVTNNNNGELEILKQFYQNSIYFFDSKSFKELQPEMIELERVYRQEDADFLEMLNRIRLGDQNETDLEKLNKNVGKFDNDEFVIELTTTNYSADSRNTLELNKINKPSHNYLGVIDRTFDLNKTRAPLNLELKVESQVLFVKNDSDKRWVNGTIGKVVELQNEKIVVKLKNGNTYEVPKATWENQEYLYNREKNKIETTVIGTFTQYPLKLAWSITIHKSQGLTLEKVFVNFSSGAFASGQAYVALSRCKSFEGIRFRNKIQNDDIIVDKRVKEFTNSFKMEFMHFEYPKLIPILVKETKCPDFGPREYKFGFANDKMEILIPPKYDSVTFFNENIAKVSINGSYSLIDSTNKRLKKQGHWYKYITNFKNGVAIAIIDRGYLRYEFIDMTMNCIKEIRRNLTIDRNYFSINIEFYFQYAFISNEILSKYDYCDKFQNGYARVNKNGCMDYSEFDDSGVFAYGLWGIIDVKGNEVYTCIFNEIKILNENLFLIEEHYGVFNEKGEKIFNYNYDNIQSFSEGLAAVKLDGYWGYIDNRGFIIIENKYENALDFKEGLAAVQKNNKWGFIDKNGSIIIDFEFDAAKSFENNLANVKKNNF